MNPLPPDRETLGACSSIRTSQANEQDELGCDVGPGPSYSDEAVPRATLEPGATV